MIKMGYADAFDEKIFDEALRQLVLNNVINPDGNLKKIKVAEVLNSIVFGKM